MTLDVFDKGKTYSDDNPVEAVDYTSDNGADIINMQLGYTIPMQRVIIKKPSGMYKRVRYFLEL